MLSVEQKITRLEGLLERVRAGRQRIALERSQPVEESDSLPLPAEPDALPRMPSRLPRIAEPKAAGLDKLSIPREDDDALLEAPAVELAESGLDSGTFETPTGGGTPVEVTPEHDDAALKSDAEHPRTSDLHVAEPALTTSTPEPTPEISATQEPEPLKETRCFEATVRTNGEVGIVSGTPRRQRRWTVEAVLERAFNLTPRHTDD